MQYYSTRDINLNKTFEEIIIQSLCKSGGLYLPMDYPTLNYEEIFKNNPSYNDIAYSVLSNFIGSSIKDNDLKNIIKKTYDGFSCENSANLFNYAENKFILELFYGPTLAFKDYPLQLLGNLFDYYLNKNNKKITIIGATSGDTGSAAIHACKDKENINIFILHPYQKTSELQRKQMTTVNSKNVFNIAIKGNFDDCQNIIKNLFVSEKLNSLTNLTAINSINWARIISQTIYFIWAIYKTNQYGKQKINFIVPTGNFGNIFAASVAKRMGLPINKLHIATNKNDIMHRTINYGDMELKKVSETLSPSMDIQISSNFERELFYLYDKDPNQISNIISSFKSGKKYQIAKDRLNFLKETYVASKCNDELTLDTIKLFYEKYQYIADPHTATGLSQARSTPSDEITINLACAHPAKFPDAIKKAIGHFPTFPEELKQVINKKECFEVMENDDNMVMEYIVNSIS